MCRLRLPAVVLFGTLATSSLAMAGPVTGIVSEPIAQPTSADPDRRYTVEEQQSGGGFAAGSLFDGFGLPLLRMSAPIYLTLDSRPKIRDLGAAQDPTAAFDNSSSGSGGDIGNVNPNPGGGTTTGGGGGTVSVPEPAALLLLGPAAWLALRRRRSATIAA